MLVGSTYLHAQDFSVLDDVTMQVIEMEQLPDDVIKMIPLPNHKHNMQPNQVPGIQEYIDPLTGLPLDPTLVDPLPDGSYGIEPIPSVDPTTGANYPLPTDPGMIPPDIPPDPGMNPPEMPPDPVMEPPQLPPVVDNLPPDPGALP